MVEWDIKFDRYMITGLVLFDLVNVLIGAKFSIATLTYIILNWVSYWRRK